MSTKEFQFPRVLPGVYILFLHENGLQTGEMIEIAMHTVDKLKNINKAKGTEPISEIIISNI